MTRTRKAYRLSQRIKYEDTKPEQVVAMMLGEIGYQPLSHPIIRIQDGYEGAWVITPDFRLAVSSQRTFVVKRVVVEAPLASGDKRIAPNHAVALLIVAPSG